jgi:hypothetical protein
MGGGKTVYASPEGADIGYLRKKSGPSRISALPRRLLVIAGPINGLTDRLIASRKTICPWVLGSKGGFRPQAISDVQKETPP